MIDQGFVEVDQAISDALAKIGPATLKKAHREAVQYLSRQNKSRVRANVNIDGGAYTPRKNPKRKRGKMMKHMAKRIKTRFNADRGLVFLNGVIAGVHHYGMTEKGVSYPERQLLGISREDKEAVLGILLRNLEF